MHRINEKKKITNIISELKNWLLYSGIQCTDDEFTKGAYRLYYNFKTDSYAFAFSELSGYAITGLLYLNKYYPDSVLIDHAKLAAAYIINRSKKKFGGAIEDRFFYETRTMRPWLFSFDNGICLNGLVNLYRDTKEEKYLEIAQKIANWLINDMQKPDGSFHAAYDYEEEKLIEDLTIWSQHSEPHHAKIAIGLLNLYEITNDGSLKESAFKICDWALKKQKSDGRFITFELQNSTQIHAHLYAAEALLYVGMKYEYERYVKSSREATEWVLSLQFPNGAFPRQFVDGKVINEESIYELIQTLRLQLLHNLFTGYEFKYGDLNKALERMLNYQCFSENQKMKYGMYFQIKDNEVALPLINGGAPLVAIQILTIYCQKLLNKFNFDLNLFV